MVIAIAAQHVLAAYPHCGRQPQRVGAAPPVCRKLKGNDAPRARHAARHRRCCAVPPRRHRRSAFRQKEEEDDTLHASPPCSDAPAERRGGAHSKTPRFSFPDETSVSFCPPSGSGPLWRLSAHEAPACSLSFCPAAPGLLATASTDKKACVFFLLSPSAFCVVFFGFSHTNPNRLESCACSGRSRTLTLIRGCTHKLGPAECAGHRTLAAVPSGRRSRLETGFGGDSRQRQPASDGGAGSEPHAGDASKWGHISDPQ